MGIRNFNGGTARIGDMRSKAEFQSNAPIADGAGGFTDNFTTFYTCRGRLQQIDGRRSEEVMEIVRNKKFELVVRYSTELFPQLTVGTRVLIGTTVYTIDTFELVEQKPHWIAITLATNV